MRQEIKAIKNTVKNIDGFFASYFTSKISVYFVWLFAKLKIKPDIVTFLSLIIDIAAAYYILKNRLIVGAILIQLSFVFDCVDGQLARYTNQKSKFGSWLDTTTDRIKEFLIIFSIGYSYFIQTNDARIFILTFLAIFLISLRHYDKSKRLELGLFDDRLEEKKHKTIGLTRFKAIIKESMLFGISERWFLISFFLIINQIQLLYYFYIFFALATLIIKSAYVWVNYYKNNNKL